ncbi:MAG: lipopolysaccharide heptosyltransferase II [bacterium]
MLIRIPNWLGDAVMATASIRHYCRMNPADRITLVGVPQTLPVYLHYPEIEQLIEFDYKGKHIGFAGLFHTGIQLRKQQFDKSYLLTNSFSSALLFSIADIPERIGYAGQLRNWLLTEKVCPGNNGHHQVEKYAYLLDRTIPSSLKTEIIVLHEELDEASGLLQREGIHGTPLIGIAMGAAYGPSKRWSARRFGILAGKLSEQLGAGTVFLGSKADQEISEDSEAAAGGAAVNLTGRTSLRQLFAILKHCSLVICNDSGIMHSANALGIPVLAIFGPTLAKETSPYGPNARILQKALPCSPCHKRICPLGHHECMESITVDEVLQTAIGMLAEQTSRAQGE